MPWLQVDRRDRVSTVPRALCVLIQQGNSLVADPDSRVQRTVNREQRAESEPVGTADRIGRLRGVHHQRRQRPRIAPSRDDPGDVSILQDVRVAKVFDLGVRVVQQCDRPVVTV
nr:hypothetical protein [Micromonospora sp. DSM 115978]